MLKFSLYYVALSVPDDSEAVISPNLYFLRTVKSWAMNFDVSPASHFGHQVPYGCAGAALIALLPGTHSWRQSQY